MFTRSTDTEGQRTGTSKAEGQRLEGLHAGLEILEHIVHQQRHELVILHAWPIFVTTVRSGMTLTSMDSTVVATACVNRGSI